MSVRGSSLQGQYTVIESIVHLSLQLLSVKLFGFLACATLCVFMIWPCDFGVELFVMLCFLVTVNE